MLPTFYHFQEHLNIEVSFVKKVYRIGLYEQFLCRLIQKCTELGEDFCIHKAHNQKIGEGKSLFRTNNINNFYRIKNYGCGC